MSTETKIEIAMKLSCKLIKEIKDKHKLKDNTISLMQITSKTDIITNHIENIIDKTKCPMCQGIFKYRISTQNGHIMGSCERKDCLSIME